MLNPKCPKAWMVLGAILSEQGKLPEGCWCFENAIRLDPASPDALNNFGVSLLRQGRLVEAASRFQEALTFAPGSIPIQMNLAPVLGRLGLHNQALRIVAQILCREPNLVEALLLAGSLESSMGRQDSLVRFELALKAAPGRPDILILRAEIFCRLRRWEDALLDCESALRKAPGMASAWHAKALALKGQDMPELALEAFRYAEASDPESATIVVDRARLLAELGQREEALAAFDQALQLQPGLTSALSYRAYLTRNPSPIDIETMERLFQNPDGSSLDQINLSFALGQAYLKTGDGARAFSRLQAGNRLKRALLDYDSEAEEKRARAIETVFSAEFLSRFAGCGDASARPIFVFGMPRSGTTLVEQILGSHTSVHGGGEPTYLCEIIQSFGEGAFADLLKIDCAGLGGKYLERISGICPDALHFVDKMPWNFLYAGLISIILPNARMIHCRRDPLDTCLSCYSTLFENGHAYSYDLEELGRYYRLYDMLMGHWRGVISPRRLLEVQYETLVEQTEDEVRKILKFCSLPWDPSCLRFYEGGRRVTSASLDQVRSPIYRTSLGRARAFRPWLKTLEAALGPSLAVGDADANAVELF